MGSGLSAAVVFARASFQGEEGPDKNLREGRARPVGPHSALVKGIVLNNELAFLAVATDYVVDARVESTVLGLRLSS